MKVLVIVDVQNDFVDGALGVDKDHEVTKKIADYAYICKCEHEPIVVTRDTHEDTYFETLEGKKLPVKHCIKETAGWQLASELGGLVTEDNVIDKTTFGSAEDLPDKIQEIDYSLRELYGEGVTEIELVGYCTDICVVSNALILRANFPDMNITVLENLCLGTTEERHNAALDVMRSCQIDVKRAIGA